MRFSKTIWLKVDLANLAKSFLAKNIYHLAKSGICHLAKSFLANLAKSFLAKTK